MKFMITVNIPVEDSNDIIKSGQLSNVLQQVLGDVKPEAVYFAPSMGTRSMFVIVDIADGSKIPSVLEPFWLGLNASIEMTPLFTMDEMKKAGPDIEALAKRY